MPNVIVIVIGPSAKIVNSIPYDNFLTIRRVGMLRLKVDEGEYLVKSLKLRLYISQLILHLSA